MWKGCIPAVEGWWSRCFSLETVYTISSRWFSREKRVHKSELWPFVRMRSWWITQRLSRKWFQKKKKTSGPVLGARRRAATWCSDVINYLQCSTVQLQTTQRTIMTDHAQSAYPKHAAFLARSQPSTRWVFSKPVHAVTVRGGSIGTNHGPFTEILVSNVRLWFSSRRGNVSYCMSIIGIYQEHN